jgi:hypothetical protein
LYPEYKPISAHYSYFELPFAVLVRGFFKYPPASSRLTRCRLRHRQIGPNSQCRVDWGLKNGKLRKARINFTKVPMIVLQP